jgi:hypothetical protein
MSSNAGYFRWLAKSAVMLTFVSVLLVMLGQAIWLVLDNIQLRF